MLKAHFTNPHLILTVVPFSCIYHSAPYGIYENSIGGANTYQENTCKWTNPGPSDTYFVYVAKNAGNDKICASNTVDNGLISNAEVNRRC